jgi:hypothetical protein
MLVAVQYLRAMAELVLTACSVIAFEEPVSEAYRDGPNKIRYPTYTQARILRKILSA